MKAQIQYKKVDGTDGVALMHSAITSMEEAKRELAAKLDLPETPAGIGEDALDARLRQADILPESIFFSQISE